jgi:hypothetical protein
VKALQICPHGMERVIPCGRLYRLPGHLHGDQDSLPLEPFRSQPILVIGPFSFGDHAPGRRLQRHRPISEFVEGQHASPFRSVPEGGQRIG